MPASSMYASATHAVITPQLSNTGPSARTDRLPAIQVIFACLASACFWQSRSPVHAKCTHHGACGHSASPTSLPTRASAATGAARPSMQQGKGPAHWQANAKGTAKPLEPQVKKMKANRDITAPEVRLVGADGSHQILSLADALKAAKDAKLDLVEVAGAAQTLSSQ